MKKLPKFIIYFSGIKTFHSTNVCSLSSEVMRFVWWFLYKSCWFNVSLKTERDLVLLSGQSNH